MFAPSNVITSRANQRVKQLRAAVTGNRRLSGGLVAIEGEHLLEEALRSGIVPTTVFATPQRHLPVTLPRTTELQYLSEEVFASAVESQSPQGIAALIEPLASDLEPLLQLPSALLLLAAELQDPGNLGTLIRSAEAFGAAAVLTAPGTVSAWNPKALRASAGSTFRVPVVQISHTEMPRLTQHRFQILAAVGDQHSGAAPMQKIDLTSPTVLMIGNEGSGLSEAWLQAATGTITVPCTGPVESLNAAVAGSLLLYEASRQRFSLPPHSTTGPLQPRPAKVSQ